MRGSRSSRKIDRIAQIAFGVILLAVAIAVSIITLSHLSEFARHAAIIVTASIVIMDMVVIAAFVAAILGIKLPDDYIEEDNTDADKKS